MEELRSLIVNSRFASAPEPLTLSNINIATPADSKSPIDYLSDDKRKQNSVPTSIIAKGYAESTNLLTPLEEVQHDPYTDLTAESHRSESYIIHGEDEESNADKLDHSFGVVQVVPSPQSQYINHHLRRRESSRLRHSQIPTNSTSDVPQVSPQKLAGKRHARAADPDPKQDAKSIVPFVKRQKLSTLRGKPAGRYDNVVTEDVRNVSKCSAVSNKDSGNTSSSFQSEGRLRSTVNNARLPRYKHTSCSW